MCQEIWNSLHLTYLPTPTEHIWNKAAEGFSEVGGFPNGLGSINGKHIKLKCPSNRGSSYFYYTNFFCIVLLAVVDHYYKFMAVDMGVQRQRYFRKFRFFFSSTLKEKLFYLRSYYQVAIILFPMYSLVTKFCSPNLFNETLP